MATNNKQILLDDRELTKYKLIKDPAKKPAARPAAKTTSKRPAPKKK